MSNWREITAGPEHLRGIDRYPEFPNDQDFSDAVIDPTLEAVGRLVQSCSFLEIALFRALSTLDLRISFTEAESKHRPKGCIRKLRMIAAELEPVRVRGARGRTTLEALLDDAHEYLELRHGVVHGRPGRQHMSEVYESRRWVVRKSEEPELVTTVYDRNRLMLAAARAGNVASDILAGLEDWEHQKERIRRDQRKALGPGHRLRVEAGGTDVGISHALSTGTRGRTLCGLDASAMEPAFTFHADESQRMEIVFEDSSSNHHSRYVGGRPVSTALPDDPRIRDRVGGLVGRDPPDHRHDGVSPPAADPYVRGRAIRPHVRPGVLLGTETVSCVVKPGCASVESICPANGGVSLRGRCQARRGSRCRRRGHRQQPRPGCPLQAASCGGRL